LITLGPDPPSVCPIADAFDGTTPGKRVESTFEAIDAMREAW